MAAPAQEWQQRLWTLAEQQVTPAVEALDIGAVKTYSLSWVQSNAHSPLRCWWPFAGATIKDPAAVRGEPGLPVMLKTEVIKNLSVKPFPDVRGTQTCKL